LTLSYKSAWTATPRPRSADSAPACGRREGVEPARRQAAQIPIEFKEATRQDDIFDITLPPGYVVDELPKPVLAECAYGTYKSEVQVADNVLHYKRTYEIKDVVVSSQKLDEVRDFFHQIAADERSSAVLRRANP
jgi:hypothetical protein